MFSVTSFPLFDWGRTKSSVSFYSPLVCGNIAASVARAPPACAVYRTVRLGCGRVEALEGRRQIGLQIVDVVEADVKRAWLGLRPSSVAVR